MPITPDIQRGQSVALRGQAINRAKRFNRDIIGKEHSSVEKIITNAAIGVSGATVTEMFPTDMPKYHITFYRHRANPAQIRTGLGIQFDNAIYKLPLPRELNDASEVVYDDNWNPIRNIVPGAIRDIGEVIGFKVNGFKSVVLDIPNFKRHRMSWKLSAKSFGESIRIQRLIANLRKDMLPASAAGGTGSLVLRFPKIFRVQFNHEKMPQWLYKFKPCVIETIQIDYAGGNPVPSFYSGIAENNPAESIMLSIQLLELELWIEENIVLDSDGLPTTDPFDAETRTVLNRPSSGPSDGGPPLTGPGADGTP